MFQVYTDKVLDTWSANLPCTFATSIFACFLSESNGCLGMACGEQLLNFVAQSYHISLCPRGWRKRQRDSAGTSLPTENITCPHGALLPEGMGLKARRVAVPPSVWQYFAETLPAAWMQKDADTMQGREARPMEAGSLPLDNGEDATPDSNAMLLAKYVSCNFCTIECQSSLQLAGASQIHEAGLCSGIPLLKTIPIHVQWCAAGFIAPACPSLLVLEGCHLSKVFIA